MRTLAQIISLTVVGSALKPRGDLKWLHKMHLLLKKRHPAAPCPHQHPSQKAPEFPVDLVQTPHTISAMSCQWEVISRFLPLPGLWQHCLCFIHRCHLSLAQSCSREGCGLSGCKCVHNSSPIQLFWPRPWALPKGLQQTQGSAQRTRCLSRLTNRITALLHFRAGGGLAVQQRGSGGSPWALPWAGSAESHGRLSHLCSGAVKPMALQMHPWCNAWGTHGGTCLLLTYKPSAWLQLTEVPSCWFK